MKTLTHLAAEDFERVAALLGPSELVEGEIVAISPGGLRHSEITGNIFFLLESHNRRSKAGRVLTNETGIVVKTDPATVRGADVLYISYQRLPSGDDWKGFLRHPPELVAEVLSEEDSWKRMEIKVAEYHAFGVDLVWVADPQTLAVRLYPNSEEPSVLQQADEIVGGLPGFRCSVKDIFRS